MKIDILEDEDNKLKIRVHDNATLVNLVNENLWKQKSLDFAAVTIEHPYMAKPVLTVKSSKAKKALMDAAEQVVEDIKELRKKAAKI